MNRRDNRKQVLFFTLLIILFFLLMGLNSRLTEYFRLSGYHNQMETRIYSLQNTEIALRTQIAFATSEYAIEAWARGEAHLAKPDDQVIIPLSTSNSLDTKFEPFNQGEKKMQNWQIWWQLFFGG